MAPAAGSRYSSLWTSAESKWAELRLFLAAQYSSLGAWSIRNDSEHMSVAGYGYNAARGSDVVDDRDFGIRVVAYDVLDCADPSMPPGFRSDPGRDRAVNDADFSVAIDRYDDLL